MRLERVPGFPPRGTPGIFWLGQAGFWIETGMHRILIDPYLSDSLARKYAGTANDHKRMMPPPIALPCLPKPDLVLITHAHTDHMDPDTLGPLAARWPGLPFVVPAACEEVARERIGAKAQLLLANADTSLHPLEGLEIAILPAAHETLEKDEAGRNIFLGYGITAGALRLYHSGDSVPFEGLAERVARFAPQVLMLPVNGRDATRLAARVPGNFHLSEAIALASDFPYLIPHHFDMFAFNTLDPQVIDAAAREHARPRIVRPRAGETLKFV